MNSAPGERSRAPGEPAVVTSDGGDAVAINVDPAHLRHARSVADAILYEGYLLYPYRADAQKNQARFQFGVLMPPVYRSVDAGEMSATQTECLLECRDDAQVHVMARFLHLQRGSVETISAGIGHPGGAPALDASAGTGSEPAPWDEAIEREQDATASVAELLAARRETVFHIGGGQSTEARTDVAGNVSGWTLRQWSALRGTIALEAQRVAGPYHALRLRVRVENHSQANGRVRSRQDGLRQALIAAQVLIAVPGATFLSMVDPPEWAAAEVAACVNTGTWPVLAGPEDCRDLMLSSPVILYDHPEIAAESAGDLYDATEIDEILTLRTMALTDAEKRQARVTDPRAAALIDRVGDMPKEMLERMHGAIRYLRAVPGAQAGAGGPGVSGPGATGPDTSGPDTSGPDAAGVHVPGLDVREDAAGLDVREDAAGLDVREDAAGLDVREDAAGRDASGMDGSGPAGPVSLLAGSAPPGYGSSAAPGSPLAAMAGDTQVPWWDPGADTSVSPETDHIIIDGVRIARGSRVRMRPGSRRTDAQDLFLVGREAVIEAVLHDVDGHIHLAVTPADDPAADLNRQHGRFLYFAPDEVEPIGTAPSTIVDQPEEEAR